MQLLRMQFQVLQDRAALRGWTRDDFRRYNQLKATLQDLRQVEAREHWGRKLASLAANYREPRKFWREVKCLSRRMMGSDTYLIDHTGYKLYTKNDKEQLLLTSRTACTAKTMTTTLTTTTRCWITWLMPCTGTTHMTTPTLPVSQALLHWTV